MTTVLHHDFEVKVYRDRYIMDPTPQPRLHTIATTP